MNSYNNIKNNNLNAHKTLHQPFSTWLQVTNTTEISRQQEKLSNICKRFQQQKRWILCVNGNDQEMKHLAQQVDSSKLLRVNKPKSDVSFEKIKDVLIKGNCSTVVLYHCDYNQQQLLILQQCAQVGNTQCVVINQHGNTLH